jgi:hypothetical protein
MELVKLSGNARFHNYSEDNLSNSVKVVKQARFDITSHLYLRRSSRISLARLTLHVLVSSSAISVELVLLWPEKLED